VNACEASSGQSDAQTVRKQLLSSDDKRLVCCYSTEMVCAAVIGYEIESRQDLVGGRTSSLLGRRTGLLCTSRYDFLMLVASAAERQ
jgi:uncharacterized membrane protein YhiD involved in acid resistance